MTGRKHCRQVTSAQINSFRLQSAMPRYPMANVIRIMRPQILGCRGVGLDAGPAEIPGGVESEHRAWRHTDAIVRDHAQQQRACRCAGAVDGDGVPGFAERLIPAQISGDPAAAVVEYSFGCRRQCGRAASRQRCRLSWRSRTPGTAALSGVALAKAFLHPANNSVITIRRQSS